MAFFANKLMLTKKSILNYYGKDSNQHEKKSQFIAIDIRISLAVPDENNRRQLNNGL